MQGLSNQCEVQFSSSRTLKTDPPSKSNKCLLTTETAGQFFFCKFKKKMREWLKNTTTRYKSFEYSMQRYATQQMCKTNGKAKPPSWHDTAEYVFPNLFRRFDPKILQTYYE